MSKILVDSDYINYDKFIQSALQDDNVFNTFKQNSAYQQILEHVPYGLGKIYYDRVMRDEPSSIGKVNDAIGSPVYHVYDGKKLSTTTLRYLFAYVDIKKFFGTLDGLNVAEIGAGYGGQYVVLDHFFNLNSYTTYDIESACGLTRKYTSKIGTKAPLETKWKIEKDREYDFIFSSYAFTEFNINVQREYLEKVISGVKKGYMIVNTEQGLKYRQMLEAIPGSKIEPSVNSAYTITWGM